MKQKIIFAAFKKLWDKLTARKPNYREWLLINAVAFVALFIWGSSLLETYRIASAANTETRDKIHKNEMLLSMSEIVRKRLSEKAQELHGGNEITGTDLLSIIGDLGGRTGLRPESSRPTSKVEGPFDIITVRITIRNAPLGNLIEFDESISNEFPSVAVTDARFTPASADGMTLTASYEITAFLLRKTDNKKQPRR